METVNIKHSLVPNKKSTNIPTDGNSLFWAVTLSYLTSAKNDDRLFESRVKKLFGTDSTLYKPFKKVKNFVGVKSKKLQLLKAFISRYNPFESESTTNFDSSPELKKLVTEVFRKKVVRYMRAHKNKCLPGISDSDQNAHLAYIEQSGRLAGGPEIKAMREMLECDIKVYNSDDNIDIDSDSANIVTLYQEPLEGQSSFSNAPTRYNFAVPLNIIDSNPEKAIILPPSSGKLEVDEKLKLSDTEFDQNLNSEKYVKLQDSGDKFTALTNSIPVYPNDYILAQLAYRANKEQKDGKVLTDLPSLPEGWRLLTTAYNDDKLNGYFGAAYCNTEKQQIVISHRGTKIKSLGSVWTDIKGIIFNSDTTQITQVRSAVTFTNKVMGALNELNRNHGVNFHLSFTGHSLGGWLAQITTFTANYLKKEGNIFLKDRDLHNFNYHTVVFDSPGCEPALFQMQDKFDVRGSGRSLSLEFFDITNYVSVPNLINTRNRHIGLMYRVFIDLSSLPDKLSKRSFATHQINKIKEVFDPETGRARYEKGSYKIQEVVDWPISEGLDGKEYNDFYKWATKFNNYNPNPVNEKFRHQSLIRYQTKLFDEKKCSINIFNQREREFLQNYHVLRENSESEFLSASPDNGEVIAKTKEILQDFELKGNIISSRTSQDLQNLIAYVQNVFHFFPDLEIKKEKQPVCFNLEELVSSFTGRDQDIKEIHTYLESKKIFVVSGLSGVGKTQLAIKYAHSHKTDYEGNVIWINSENYNSLEKSFKDLAVRLGISNKDRDGTDKGIENIVWEVYKQFYQRKSIFVFDNTEAYQDIEAFLPDKNYNSRVLITSNNRDLFNEQEHEGVGKLYLEVLPEAEAVKFTKKVLGIEDSSQDSKIKELANTLGRLPLALQYAAAYIKNSNFAIDKYIRIYKTSEQEVSSLLNRSDLDRYGKTIFNAFKTTFDNKIKGDDSELAIKIFNIMAYFAPDNIPDGHMLASYGANGVDSDRAKGELIRSMKLLKKYSMIDEGKNGSFSVHRLVQEVVRQDLKEKEKNKGVLKDALELLKNFSEAGDKKLHLSCVWRYASEHNELIQEFIVNEAKGNKITTPLHLLAEGGDVKSIKEILEYVKKSHRRKLNEIINAVNENGNTPLHLGSKNGHSEVVEFLLGDDIEGVDVNAETNQKFTPLHLAAKENHLSIVNTLLGKGANIDAQTKQKFTPLHFAAKNGYLEIVNALLNKGAKVTNFDEYKITPLHLAAEMGHVKVIEALIRKEPGIINAKTPLKTPLMWAAQKGKINAVKILLEHKADIEFRNSNGETALKLAAKGEHWETALVLASWNQIQ